MQQKQRGFTLLEVMVVIVILGVLASLVVPNLLGNKEKADQQKAVTDISSLEQSLEMYKLDNSVFPTTDQGLEALVTKPSSSWNRVIIVTVATLSVYQKTHGVMSINTCHRVNTVRLISSALVLMVKKAVMVLIPISATGIC